MVLESKPTRNNTWDSDYIYEKNWKSQLNFLSVLPKKIRNLVTIRLHKASSYPEHTWYELSRLKKFDKHLNIDNGFKPINGQLKNSRIAIICYDSTIILEAFSANYPFIIFLPDGINHFKDNVKIDHEMLIRSELLFTNYLDLKEKIEEVHLDTISWWESMKVQEARSVWINKYTKISNNKVSDLKNLIEKKL